MNHTLLQKYNWKVKNKIHLFLSKKKIAIWNNIESFFKIILTCIAIKTASPNVKEICNTEGLIPKLPMQPAHPINTKMAVPIVSLRAMVNISQLLTVSSVKLFKPGTNRKKKTNLWFSKTKNWIRSCYKKIFVKKIWCIVTPKIFQTK